MIHMIIRGTAGVGSKHADKPKHRPCQIGKLSMSAARGGGGDMPICRHAENDSIVHLIFSNKSYDVSWM